MEGQLHAEERRDSFVIEWCCFGRSSSSEVHTPLENKTPLTSDTMRNVQLQVCNPSHMVTCTTVDMQEQLSGVQPVGCFGEATIVRPKTPVTTVFVSSTG